MLPRYRGVAAGTFVETFPVYRRRLHARRRLLRGAARRRRPRHPRRLSRAVRSSRALRRRQRRLCRQPAPVCVPGARRARIRGAARRRRRRSSTRTTGRRGWRRCISGRCTRTHPVLGGMPSVFTIHNLAYQGLFDAGLAAAARSRMGPAARSIASSTGAASAFSKAASTTPTCVTTVSRRYAEEIQTPAFGFGFDGILRARRADLVGILNGIDTREWDPATDPALPRPYSRRRSGGEGRRESGGPARATACRPTMRRCGGRSSGWCRGWSIRKASI